MNISNTGLFLIKQLDKTINNISSLVDSESKQSFLNYRVYKFEKFIIAEITRFECLIDFFNIEINSEDTKSEDTKSFLTLTRDYCNNIHTHLIYLLDLTKNNFLYIKNEQIVNVLNEITMEAKKITKLIIKTIA